MKPTLKTRLLWTGAYGKQRLQAARRRFRTGASPDLLIVGAQKAGTTSLFNYLEQVAGFFAAQRKEIGFFNREECFARGTDWYERFFEAQKDGVRFEATPEYLYDPAVPERIRNHYPDVRIVCVLREPVARAYSAWNMYCQWAKARFVPLAMWQSRHHSPLYKLFFTGQPPSFRQYVDYETKLMQMEQAPLEPGILRRGIYVDQITRFLDTFGPKQFLALGFQDLVNSPEETIERVRDFVHAQDPNVPFLGGHEPAYNVGQYPSSCPEDIADRLRRFYTIHNERLWRVLGHQVTW